GYVIVADEPHLVGNPDAVAEHERLQHAGRDEVVGREDCVGARIRCPLGELGSGGPSAQDCGVWYPYDFEFAVGILGDGEARSFETVGDLADAERPADEGDAAVALLDKVLSCYAAARDVVDGDGAPFVGLGVAVDEHRRDAAGPQLGQPVGDVADGRDEHPAQALYFEEFEVAGFALGPLLAAAEKDRAVGGFGCLFGTARYVGEEGVADVEHYEPDGSAVPRAQLPG